MIYKQVIIKVSIVQRSIQIYSHPIRTCSKCWIMSLHRPAICLLIFLWFRRKFLPIIIYMEAKFSSIVGQQAPKTARRRLGTKLFKKVSRLLKNSCKEMPKMISKAQWSNNTCDTTSKYHQVQYQMMNHLEACTKCRTTKKCYLSFKKIR